MKYNFDEIIDRSGTNALKTDVLAKRYGNADLQPLWVADMDFATPPPIIDALKKRLEHPIFGYTVTPKSYFETIVHWIKIRQEWEIKQEWLTFIPGIVKGIGMAINVFTEIGDKIIIQPPIYHPFRIVPEENHRQVICNPLKLSDDQYEMDFENLEKIIDERCKMLILSNPHNPGGIIWRKETLQKLAAICAKHNILVISDEIHADLALWGNKHIPFATVSEDAAQNSITFGSPSKTFNIAGIVSSFAIVLNDKIRQKFFQWLHANELNNPTIFSIIAAEAAYNYCEHWRCQLIDYIENNIIFCENYINENIHQIKVFRPQASFLLWLDCRRFHFKHDELIDFFIHRAGLVLNDGKMFGTGGDGFMRMNIGTPRQNLQHALTKIAMAVNSQPKD
ncbi:MAG: PatB family C-S lyase [Bacteroidales bacterium]|nr:PatB family C-S lyase [Bacteroidales bacterium]